MSLSREFIGLAFAVLLAAPVPAFAWGKAGHRVAATIAASLLTPEAQAQLATLLDPSTTLADISTWADDIRPSRPNTGPWHYVNIPRGASGYNSQRDCSRGCVVSAIEQSLRLLQDRSKGRAVRQEALTWLVHLVADLHQPLHAIEDDKGGNDVIVQFNGRQTNLHRQRGRCFFHCFTLLVARLDAAVVSPPRWATRGSEESGAVQFGGFRLRRIRRFGSPAVHEIKRFRLALDRPRSCRQSAL